MNTPNSNEAERQSVLLSAIERAAHYLPQQAPLHAFVHHNPLHSFEYLPFYEGVEKAAGLLGARAYPTEEFFARLISQRSITDEDLRAVLGESMEDSERAAALGGVTYAEFAFKRLKILPETIDENAVQFLQTEERLFSDFHRDVSVDRRAELSELARTRNPGTSEEANRALLEELWNRLIDASATLRSREAAPQTIRRRDLFLREYGVDADALLHPFLIRLAAAYLDQGISYWTMPDRERGFYHCFVALYRQPFGSPERWLADLSDVLSRQHAEKFSAQDACLFALQKLQVPEAQWSQYIEESLLSLRGFAGMFRQLEVLPEKAPLERIPAQLMDYLAVSLTLEAEAALYVFRENQRESSKLELGHLLSRRPALATGGADLPLVYEAYVMAQLADLRLDSLGGKDVCEEWLRWNRGLDARLRGRLLHQAFERNHIESLIFSIAEHQKWIAHQKQPKTEYQAIFCIDDREESYRRHLEEVDPGACTYSFPGFFGVAMRYYAAGDIRPRDLCPVVLRPTHVVRETAEEGDSSWGFGSGYHLHVGTTTLLRGFLLSALGLISVVPLVLAVLFPRWFHFKKKSRDQPKTRIKFACEMSDDRHNPGSDEPGPHSPNRGDSGKPDHLPEGYTPEEMSQLVESMLTQMGLKRDFAPLVLIIGHGSSSTNNPHLAAYGCGATAGGCGGPNARVIAQMANRSDVRDLLAGRGIVIPESTWFVPGMHDTCSDDVHLYEQDGIGELAQKALVSAKKALEEASRNNAHERCRLFGEVSLQIAPEKAKSLVESRSVDLSEARPEYNHVKNSCCVVGRRELTRGLFLDQRAFLTSYDPRGDDDGAILRRVLLGSVPVGMGINLEYFFGAVDNQVYGAGSKLPHNVSGLLGVMDGHSSDLRTGLYQQMTELHEPTRLVTIVESTPETLRKILEEEPRMKELGTNGWFHLLCFDSQKNVFFRYESGEFRLMSAQKKEDGTEPVSRNVYQGRRGRVPFSHITASFEAGAA